MTNRIEIFRFFRTGNAWFVDLQSFLRSGGKQDELRMRDGAELFLDIVSQGADEVTLEISDDLTLFEADYLAMLDCERDKNGGADYLIYDLDGNKLATVWMSPPLRFYYGKYPNKFVLRSRPVQGSVRFYSQQDGVVKAG